LDLGNNAKDIGEMSDKMKVFSAVAESVGGPVFGQLVTKGAELVASFKRDSEAVKDAGEKSKLGLAQIAEGATGLFAAFQGGDIAGAIDNVTSVVTLIPGLSAFGPAIALAGGAAKLAVPFITELYSSYEKSTKSILEATKGMKEYAEAIKAANVELRESAALEAARAADKLAQEDGGKRAKERGEVFSDLTKGRGEKTLEEVVKAIHEDRADERADKLAEIQTRFDAEANKGVGAEKPGESIFVAEQRRQQRIAAAPKFRAEMGAVGSEEQGTAEDLVKGARAGDATAIRKLQQLLPKDSVTGEIARMASPEHQEEQRQARQEAEQSRKETAEQNAAEKKKAADEQRAHDELHPPLSAQGAETLQRLEGPDPTPKRAPMRRQPLIDETAPGSDLPDLDIRRDLSPAAVGRKPAASAADQMIPIMGKVLANQSEQAANTTTAIQELTRMAQQVRRDLNDTRQAQRTNQSNGNN
jgi:hypothetical protein